MDRRVKERLIGASILVALIVLVVPELLSGPKPAPPPQPDRTAANARPAHERRRERKILPSGIVTLVPIDPQT